MDFEPTRIERLGQPIDEPSLSSGVPTLEDDHHRHARLARRPLAGPQANLQVGKDLRVEFLVDLLIELNELEHVLILRAASRDVCFRYPGVL